MSSAFDAGAYFGILTFRLLILAAGIYVVIRWIGKSKKKKENKK